MAYKRQHSLLEDASPSSFGGRKYMDQQVPSPSFSSVNRQLVKSSLYMTCSNCYCTIYTRVENKPSKRTHMMALLCCLICFLPCIPLVYFSDNCLAQDHYCPKCNAFLGRVD